WGPSEPSWRKVEESTGVTGARWAFQMFWCISESEAVFQKHPCMCQTPTEYCIYIKLYSVLIVEFTLITSQPTPGRLKR
uniref:Uncharacterized protein n=1 Tax=Malurus cyaneus samueli TaxID=2593467 RepID=A0A8C5T7H5_9PASS